MWVTIETFWAGRGREAGEKRAKSGREAGKKQARSGQEAGEKPARTFTNFDMELFILGIWACK